MPAFRPRLPLACCSAVNAAHALTVRLPCCLLRRRLCAGEATAQLALGASEFERQARLLAQRQRGNGWL